LGEATQVAYQLTKNARKLTAGKGGQQDSEAQKKRKRKKKGKKQGGMRGGESSVAGSLETVEEEKGWHQTKRQLENLGGFYRGTSSFIKEKRKKKRNRKKHHEDAKRTAIGRTDFQERRAAHPQKKKNNTKRHLDE